MSLIRCVVIFVLVFKSNLENLRVFFDRLAVFMQAVVMNSCRRSNNTLHSNSYYF